MNMLINEINGILGSSISISKQLMLSGDILWASNEETNSVSMKSSFLNSRLDEDGGKPK